MISLSIFSVFKSAFESRVIFLQLSVICDLFMNVRIHTSIFIKSACCLFSLVITSIVGYIGNLIYISKLSTYTRDHGNHYLGHSFTYLIHNVAVKLVVEEEKHIIVYELFLFIE